LVDAGAVILVGSLSGAGKPPPPCRMRGLLHLPLSANPFTAYRNWMHKDSMTGGAEF
jgi:hypothetical protein